MYVFEALVFFVLVFVAPQQDVPFLLPRGAAVVATSAITPSSNGDGASSWLHRRARTIEEKRAAAAAAVQRSRARKIATDPEGFRAYTRSKQKLSRDKKKTEDPEAWRARQREYKNKWREKQREEHPEEFKAMMKEKMRKRMERKKREKKEYGKGERKRREKKEYGEGEKKYATSESQRAYLKAWYERRMKDPFHRQVQRDKSWIRYNINSIDEELREARRKTSARWRADPANRPRIQAARERYRARKGGAKK